MQEKDRYVEKRLEDAYGEYIDMQPCFPPCHEISTIELPAYLDVMDRVNIKLKQKC